MYTKLFALSLGFGGLILATDQAHGQTAQKCAERGAVVAQLAEKYGEVRQGVGLAGQGGVVEIFASTDTGTWTITVTLANGLTCLLASGESYEQLSEAPPTPGSPA